MKTTEQKIIFSLRVLISALFLLLNRKIIPNSNVWNYKSFWQGQLIPMGFSESIALIFLDLLLE